MSRAPSENRRILYRQNEVQESNVLCFQFTVVFPSWTSRVRIPSPAPCFHVLTVKESLSESALNGISLKRILPKVTVMKILVAHECQRSRLGVSRPSRPHRVPL